MKRLGDSLGNKTLSAETFHKVVRQLNLAYKQSSQELSNVILEALDERDNGNVEKAIEMFRGFNKSSSSPCHKEVATYYISELSSNSI